MVSITTPTNTPIASPITTPRNRPTTPSPSPHTIHSPSQPRARTSVSGPRTPPKQIITPSTTTPPPAPRKPKNGIIPFSAESVRFVKKHQLAWDFHVLKTTVLVEVGNGTAGNGREVKKEVGRDREAKAKANPAVNKDIANRSGATDTWSERKIHTNKDLGAKEEPAKKTATPKTSSGRARGSAALGAATNEKVLEWRKEIVAGKPVEMKVVCGMVVEVTKLGVKAKTQPAGIKEAVEKKKEGLGEKREAVKRREAGAKKVQGKRKARGRKGLEDAVAVTGAGSEK